jgi:hypothetical protein
MHVPKAPVPVHLETPSHVSAIVVAAQGQLAELAIVACNVLGMVCPLQHAEVGPHGPGVGLLFAVMNASQERRVRPNASTFRRFTSSIAASPLEPAECDTPHSRCSAQWKKSHASRKLPDSIYAGGRMSGVASGGFAAHCSSISGRSLLRRSPASGRQASCNHVRSFRHRDHDGATAASAAGPLNCERKH